MASTPSSNDVFDSRSIPIEEDTNIVVDEVHSTDEISVTNVNTEVAVQGTIVAEGENENANSIENKRRRKTSNVWSEFKEVILPGGKKKVECIHCKKQLALGSTGATTQYRRHLDKCAAKIRTLRSQNILHLQHRAGSSNANGNEDSASLTIFKYDNSKVREMIAHYILINEKPFSVVEEYGFNLVLKSTSPYFCKYSSITARSDVLLVYEQKKRKLKQALSGIRRISFTTDLYCYILKTLLPNDGTFKDMLQMCI